MKKEKVIQSAVMLVVSILVLVGFTVAWFSGSLGDVVAGGMRMSAAEQGDIRIALESGGADISTLVGDDKYVDVGLEELTNIEFIQKDENGNPITDGSGNPVKVWKMAPGAYGEVVFYVTPLKQMVGSCTVLPEVRLKKEDGTLVTKENGEIDVPDGAGGTKKVNVYEIANEHIIFYYKADGSDTPIYLNVTTVSGEGGASVTTRESAVFPLTWDSGTNTGNEREVRLYWRWDYEYPPEGRTIPSYEGSSLTDQEKEALYDEQDTIIGNYIKQMNFHFEFTSSPGTAPSP